ncbi:MAG: Eco57I restriction-modification methylase domain-containing protein [Bradymonadaceae bacterium]
MNKDTRNRIQRATQAARRLLEDEYGEQLEGTFDILLNGTVLPDAGPHLDEDQRVVREKLVAAVAHKRALGLKPVEAVESFLREAAFTTLNRFVALKMLEARGLVQECVSKGEDSAGFKEFTSLASGLVALPDRGYRLYLESIFDEIGQEVRVLFDRRDVATVLWPRRSALQELLKTLNDPELSVVWGEDETIGWVYQYFNGEDERRAMREASQAPRNSRELAVRNQFFTPRYVVSFLTDNTLGRTWIEMMRGATRLVDLDYYVKPPEEAPPRAKKDPRDLRILDPACGSGHFLLYAFILLLTIYEEAWNDPEAARSSSTGRTLRQDYPHLDDLRRAIPVLILERNLYGIDIDPRAAQIAALALWMRAQRAFNGFGISPSERPVITRTNLVVAEPMPGDAALVEEFASTLQPPVIGELFRKMVAEMRLAGELGSLLKIEQAIAASVSEVREEWQDQRRELGKGYLPGFAPTPKQGSLDLSGIDDATFFDDAEERIVSALRRFAEASSGGPGVRRQLFAGDAAQGVALIDLLRKPFDVVLMNPPFGAGSTQAKGVFENSYPRTKNDVYAAFVERGVELLHPRGTVGAITSRTGFFLSSFQRWREEVLLKEAPPTVFADLGYGVLDSAMVEVAAYCLERAA